MNYLFKSGPHFCDETSLQNKKTKLAFIIWIFCIPEVPGTAQLRPQQSRVSQERVRSVICCRGI